MNALWLEQFWTPHPLSPVTLAQMRRSVRRVLRSQIFSSGRPLWRNWYTVYAPMSADERERLVRKMTKLCDGIEFTKPIAIPCRMVDPARLV